MTTLIDFESTLMHLMYGHNYQVKLGSDLFVNCSNEGAFCKELKQRYQDSRAENVELILTNASDVFEEIDFGLHYRGDDSAGLKLTDKEEANLEAIQIDYRSTIKKYIDESVKIYFYPEDSGLPIYPVWWSYQVVLFLNNGNCVFIYGAASD